MLQIQGQIHIWYHFINLVDFSGVKYGPYSLTISLNQTNSLMPWKITDCRLQGNTTAMETDADVITEKLKREKTLAGR